MLDHQEDQDQKEIREEMEKMEWMENQVDFETEIIFWGSFG